PPALRGDPRERRDPAALLGQEHLDVVVEVVGPEVLQVRAGQHHPDHPRGDPADVADPQGARFERVPLQVRLGGGGHQAFSFFCSGDAAACSSGAGARGGGTAGSRARLRPGKAAATAAVSAAAAAPPASSAIPGPAAAARPPSTRPTREPPTLFCAVQRLFTRPRIASGVLVCSSAKRRISSMISANPRAAGARAAAASAVPAPRPAVAAPQSATAPSSTAPRRCRLPVHPLVSEAVTAPTAEAE